MSAVKARCCPPATHCMFWGEAFDGPTEGLGWVIHVRDDFTYVAVCCPFCGAPTDELDSETGERLRGLEAMSRALSHATKADGSQVAEEPV